jgi:hypothetical protein
MVTSIDNMMASLTEAQRAKFAAATIESLKQQDPSKLYSVGIHYSKTRAMKNNADARSAIVSYVCEESEILSSAQSVPLNELGITLNISDSGIVRGYLPLAQIVGLAQMDCVTQISYTKLR